MRFLMLALLIASSMLAQGEKAQDKQNGTGVIKFIELKYLNGERLGRVISFVNTLFLSRTMIVNDPVLKTVAIRADLAADIPPVEEMLRRFDVPAAAETKTRQIQLTVYLLEPVDEELPAGQRVPTELASTAEQLRNLFGLKNLRLIETTIMQGREDANFSTSGFLPTASGKPASTYNARYKNVRFNEAQKTVSVNGFTYIIGVPQGANFTNSHVESDLSIKDGQKLVIGKVTKGQNEPNNYLVVTARVD